MSYDVSFKVKVENSPIYITVSDSENITWNVRELIYQSSGWKIKNEDSNGKILTWIEKIEKGIKELTFYPEKYKKYESPNGWGTIAGTLRFYKRCLEIFNDFVLWHKDLIDIAVVWVE